MQQAEDQAQAKGGDPIGAKRTFVEAQKTADLVQGSDKSSALSAIAKAQTVAGEIADARKTADQIQDGYYKSLALSAVAEAEVKGGNLAGAQKTLTYAHEVAEQDHLVDAVQGRREALEEEVLAQQVATGPGTEVRVGDD